MKAKLTPWRLPLVLGLTALSLAACQDNNTTTAQKMSPVPVEQVVATQSGKISGITEEVNGQQGHTLKGIPYAAPPVGELRWKAPQPVEPWTGVREATEYGDRCAQRESRMGETDAPPSEDCLYLNVVTAADSSASCCHTKKRASLR
jgi:para-nitrobenzyl esterase